MLEYIVGTFSALLMFAGFVYLVAGNIPIGVSVIVISIVLMCICHVRINKRMDKWKLK